MLLSCIIGLTILIVKCVPENESMGDAGQTLVKVYPGGFAVLSLNPLSTSQTMSLLEVRRDLAGPSALNERTTAVLQFDSDTSILNNFNADNSTDFIPLPLNFFSTTPELQNGKMTVIIDEGEFVKTVTITVPDAMEFDFTKNYAVTFSLNTVSGEGKKSQAADSVMIVQVQAKNKYDGIYEVTANSPMIDVVNPAITGYYPFNYKLVTTGEHTCDIFELDNDYPLHPITSAAGAWSSYGAFCPMLTFDDSGDGTIVSADNIFGPDAGANMRDCILDPSGINKWEVINNTKTIRIKYIMIQKANTSLTDPWYRTFFDETWTYIGPR